MNKIIFPCLILLSLFACDRQPFVEHKVSVEKKADDCSAMQPSFRLNSNFGGERYEFEKCLPANFDRSLVTSARHGDTVVVHFQGAHGEMSHPALFQVTLDIDSYPKYSFLTIDDETYTVIPSDK